MSQHRIFIPTVHAEDLLQLPGGVHITSSYVEEGELVLSVSSAENLGATEINALYGNAGEEEKVIHFGMFEERSR